MNLLLVEEIGGHGFKSHRSRCGMKLENGPWLANERTPAVQK